MLIVDAQIHLWENDAAPGHHRSAPYGAEEAVAAMDAAGIARSINCPAIWDDHAVGYARTAASAYPDRVATMGWFPLARPADDGFVDAFFRQRGMLGLRFVIVRPADCAAFEDGALDWIWSAAARHGRPVALGVNKPMLPAVRRVVERFPEVPFLLDHLGVGPFEKLPSAIDHLDELIALARFSNIAVKASATPSMSNLSYPFADLSDPLHRIFDLFGPDRMFWGTDVTRMPIPLDRCVRHFTEHLPWLGGESLRRVMGGAVCKWVGWN